MIAKTGLSIPIRDMRLLDFNLAQNDSTILVRDNAIIASLEHARVIIMADKAIIPRQTEEQNPLASRFLDVLEESIAEWIKHKLEFERHMEDSVPTGGYEDQEYGKTSSFFGLDGHKDHEDASSGADCIVNNNGMYNFNFDNSKRRSKTEYSSFQYL